MRDNQDVWAEHARTVLIEVAGGYLGTVTYGDLAARIQAETGVRTKSLMQNWIGETLGRVAADCRRRGEPLLTSLCVSKVDGTVGPGYAVAVTASYGETPEDVELHAAQERLRCYRHFEAAGLPADGGTATLTEQVRRSRDKTRRRDQSRRREHGAEMTCGECYQVQSLTGVCGCH